MVKGLFPAVTLFEEQGENTSLPYLVSKKHFVASKRSTKLVCVKLTGFLSRSNNIRIKQSPNPISLMYTSSRHNDTRVSWHRAPPMCKLEVTRLTERGPPLARHYITWSWGALSIGVSWDHVTCSLALLPEPPTHPPSHTRSLYLYSVNITISIEGNNYEIQI
jgi:hypothetical protein